MADELDRLAEELKCVTFKDLEDGQKSVFIVTAKTYIEEGKLNEVYKVFSNKDYEVLLKSVGWDLLPCVCTYLANKNSGDENALQLLNNIAVVCNPKEVLLALLEQVDRFLNNAHFRSFLDPIQTALKRLPSHRSLSMNLVLCTFHAHLQTIQLPDTTNMNEREKKLLMLEDDSFDRAEKTLTALLDFITPFVFEIGKAMQKTLTKENQIENLKMKVEIERFLLKLLFYPLSHMDLTWNKEGPSDRDSEKSMFRCCAEQIMHYLRCMHCSYNNLITYGQLNAFGYEKEFHKQEENEDDDNIKEQCQELLPIFGLSCFAYLVIVEGVEEEYMPSVYSSLYLLDVNLLYIICMLRRQEENVIRKGIELMFTLVNSLDKGNVPHATLDQSGYIEIAACMERIMVMHPSKILRQRAVEFIKVYITKFDCQGRYKLIRHLISNTKHAGVSGLLTGIVKDEINNALQINEGLEWFAGKQLMDLLKIPMKLEKGPFSDFLHESDRIMAALNLLRYLFLRDSVRDNRTGIWSEYENIEEDFLNVLLKGIGLSRNHFAQELQDVNKQIRSKKSQDSKISVTVSGEQLPGLLPEQQLQVVRSAICTLDMMSDVLTRVFEVMTLERKKTGSSI